MSNLLILYWPGLVMWSYLMGKGMKTDLSNPVVLFPSNAIYMGIPSVQKYIHSLPGS